MSASSSRLLCEPPHDQQTDDEGHPGAAGVGEDHQDTEAGEARRASGPGQRLGRCGYSATRHDDDEEEVAREAVGLVEGAPDPLDAVLQRRPAVEQRCARRRRPRIDATSGMTAEPMAAIMIRRTAWGVVASRSSTSAITTTDRMRENSTMLTSWSLEVSVLRKQATGEEDERRGQGRRASALRGRSGPPATAATRP